MVYLADPGFFLSRTAGVRTYDIFSAFLEDGDSAQCARDVLGTLVGWRRRVNIL